MFSRSHICDLYSAKGKKRYLKTSIPQPAIAVKILGGRSLEGFIAYPVFIPMDMPITNTRSPVTTASVPCRAALFFLS